MGRCYFSGSNSGAGFCNYFDGIVPPWANLKRYFMIKGGPGVGKSTLMKRVAEWAKKKGEEVERFYCSGDPESLDAVRLVNREIVLADATSPHCMDPVEPGAVEEIINLGEQIDRTCIVKYREKIEHLLKKNKQGYQRAYAFLSAAAAMESERYKEIASCVDKRRLADCAKEMTEFLRERSEEYMEKPSRHLFLDAISCRGRISFAQQIINVEKVYCVTGLYSDVITDLLSRKMSAECKELFCSPLRPQCVNHVLVNKSALFLTSEEGENGTVLLSEGFLTKRCDTITEVFYHEARHLEDEAMNCLKDCKKIHDEIEEIYKECVDFEQITERTEQILKLLEIL